MPRALTNPANMETARPKRLRRATDLTTATFPERTQKKSSASSEQNGHEDFNLLLRGLLHEVRNPLSSILTAASLVQDSCEVGQPVDDETVMLLGVIRKESLRLNHILTEFANFIKLPQPQPESFDLVMLTRDVVHQAQHDRVLASGVQVVDGFAEECLVWADPGQISMALHQLVRNAGEAMENEGTLQLTLREAQENNVVLCIGNTGAGFSEESRRRAFQPFYSTKLQAVGLGLSTTHAVIESAGGRVWIEDKNAPHGVLHSTLLCISLPRAPETNP